MSLQNRDIFAKISADTREALFAAGEVLEVNKGSLLFDENDEIHALYIVLDGYVSLFRNSRYGDTKIIFVSAQGEALNETILEDCRTAIAAKALSECRVLSVPRTKLPALIAGDNAFAMALFASMSYKTRRLYHQVGNANRTYPMEKKLAAKIWKLARDYGRDVEAGRQIGFEITVVMLAYMLGAKRETISREVSALKKTGLLVQEDGFLTVTDMGKLREVM